MPYYDEDDIERMKDTIRSQNQKLREQDSLLRSLNAPPTHVGIVLMEQDNPLIMMDGTMMELPTIEPVHVGQTVRVAMPTEERPIMVILGPIEGITLSGDVVTFNRMDGALLEVSHDGRVKSVFPGSLSNVQEGDRLVLDKTGMIALRNLGHDEEVFTFEDINVDWSQVGGQKEAKRVLQEAIEFPSLYGKLIGAYHKPPLKGAILFGPPGNGKTLLGKAAATAIRKLQGAGKPNPFMYIKGSELLSMYVGNTEAGIRSLFARSRKFQQKYNMPMVMFFDEADATFQGRGKGISTDIANTIVPAMLSEMDGFEATGSFILMSTNRLDMLDPAILRDGRLNRMIEVTPPDMDSAPEILSIHLADKPTAKRVTHEDLIAVGVKELFSHDRLVTRDTYLKNVLNGAMLEGIVGRATSLALHRDIESHATKISGLGVVDIKAAVDQLHLEQRQLRGG